MSAQQNLVPNGSFEDTVHCPTGADIYNAKFFSSPTDGTPDYFNLCTPTSLNLSVPVNAFGYQLPKTGNAYAGMVFYGHGTDYREYIQVPLISSLKRGSFYKVECYLSLGSFSPVACNKFGFCFSEYNVYQNIPTNLNLSNFKASDKIISDTTNWGKISLNYRALGNERFVVFGNFNNDANTDTITNFPGIGEHYCYIDDISIIKSDFEIPNVFTPNSDGTNDYFMFDPEVIGVKEITIYNRWGQIVFQNDSHFSWDGKASNGLTCVAGTYYYIIQTETETYKGFIELIK